MNAFRFLLRSSLWLLSLLGFRTRRSFLLSAFYFILLAFKSLSEYLLWSSGLHSTYYYYYSKGAFQKEICTFSMLGILFLLVPISHTGRDCLRVVQERMLVFSRSPGGRALTLFHKILSCFSIHVGLCFIFLLLLFLLGMDSYVGSFFSIYIYAGLPIVFAIFWRVISKHLL